MRIRLIQSKEDYLFYLEADRISLRINRKRPNLFHDEIWKYQRLLRRVEFIENCQKNYMGKISRLEAWFWLKRLSIKLGFTISPNSFGPGLSIVHLGPIVVHPDAIIGENCRIHHCVTIGSIPLTTKVPIIGNNVFIGPGAVIAGDIQIADGIAIGANSFVNKSFKKPNITIAGCPATQVSDKGSGDYLLRATEILRQRISSISSI